MAMKYNPSTGEWEEQEEENAVAPNVSALPGSMPDLGTTSVPAAQTAPSWSYDGGDWVRQGDSGMVEARDLAGLWNPVGRGEHAESWGYTGSAVNDPTVDKLFAYKAANPTGLNTEQQAFFNNPIVGLDSYGQGSRWGNLDLFDNQFNPQQAGALMQTGGNQFLSDTDRRAGGAFNFEQSAAEQSRRAEDSSGFDLSNPMTLAMLAATIYSGGAGAGLWGGAGAGAAGMGAAELGTLAAGDAMAGIGASEFGMGLGGLSAGAASSLTSGDAMAGLIPAEDLSSWIGSGMFEGDVATNLSSMFDSSAINGLDLPQTGINGLDLPTPDAFNTFNPATDGYGMGQEVFSPDVSSLGSPEMFGPPQASEMEGLYLDDYGGGTNAAGEFVNGSGRRSVIDSISETMRNLGVDRETAAKLTQGGKSMFSNLTKPIGGSKYGPSPLGVGQGLAKLYSAYNSENQLKDILGKFQGMYDSATSYQDPNRSRGDTANSLWTENYTNPKAGYNEFMTGAGREFTDQARAQAAKSGKRGSYLNSGKMQSDLASLWMKNQNSRGDSLSRGFSSGNNTSMEALKYAPGLMDMYNKQGGSMGMAVQDILQSTAGKGLIDNVLEGYW